MRAGSGFGVVLNAHNGLQTMTQAFDGAVIEINMGNLDTGWQGVGVNGKTVVLRGDTHPTGREIFDRLIPSPVAEFEFEGLASQSGTKQLMPQADPEDRLPADQLAQRLMSVAQSGGIPWTI